MIGVGEGKASTRTINMKLGYTSLQIHYILGVFSSKILFHWTSQDFIIFNYCMKFLFSCTFGNGLSCALKKIKSIKLDCKDIALFFLRPPQFTSTSLMMWHHIQDFPLISFQGGHCRNNAGRKAFHLQNVVSGLILEAVIILQKTAETSFHCAL